MRDHVDSKQPYFHDLLVLIPSPDGIDLQKKMAVSVWTPYTCHAATLVCTIADENFGDGVLHQDCHNHMQNVWVGGLEKEPPSHLTNILRSSLHEKDPTLHVKNLFSALARAYNKGFYLSVNYP